ncbi:major facilitator superfamily (MFS) multidrug efflux pump, Bcr/CflA subfamily, partial [Burkholderia sp. H160]
MSHVVKGRPDGRLILLLGALAACGPISTDMYLPSLPTIAQAFAVSSAAAQSTLTSFMFGFSIGMLLYGPLSDTYGRRPILMGGIVMFALASIACALSMSIGSLVGFRFVQ